MRNDVRSLDDCQLTITDATCLVIGFENPLLKPGVPRVCGAFKCELFAFPVFVDFNLTARTKAGISKGLRMSPD